MKRIGKNSSSSKDEEGTLNAKINKVVEEIKKLNKQKAKEFGCGLEQVQSEQSMINISSSRKSIASASKERDSTDKLIDFIKKEKKKDDHMKKIIKDQSQKQYLTQQQALPPKSNTCKFNSRPQKSEEAYGTAKVRDDSELSELFDLTSAKQEKRKFSSENGFQTNDLVQANIYATTSTERPKVSESKRIQKKYEDILAGPGSILVENGWQRTKTLVEELQLSSAQYNEFNRITEQTSSSNTKDNYYTSNQSAQNQMRPFTSNPMSQSEQLTTEDDQEKRILEDLLQLERQKNYELQMNFQRAEQERKIVEQIIEQQEVENLLKNKEIQRIAHKSAKLSSNLVREQCIKENMENRTGYSNPAKLMNYLRKNKQGYDSSSHYMSHIEAYHRISSKKTDEQMAKQKILLNQMEMRNTAIIKKEQDREYNKSSARVDHKPHYRSDTFTEKESPVQQQDKEISGKQSMKESLEIQRRALRDFSNYYQFNK